MNTEIKTIENFRTLVRADAIEAGDSINGHVVTGARQFNHPVLGRAVEFYTRDADYNLNHVVMRVHERIWIER